jgi:hypothetical protein
VIFSSFNVKRVSYVFISPYPLTFNIKNRLFNIEQEHKFIIKKKIHSILDNTTKTISYIQSRPVLGQINLHSSIYVILLRRSNE